MVKLKKVSITDFMNIESLDLEFEDKTTIMIGGGNGEGKSAFVNALAFAIVGYRKGDSYRDYVRRGKEEAQIQLWADMKDYPIFYDIKITNKKYKPPLSRRIEYKGKTYINSECDLLIKELDIEYLEHAMFLYQNNSSIVDLKPAERARLLKKLFHFEFEEYVAILKSRIEDEKSRMQDASIRYDQLSKQTFEETPLLEEKTKDEIKGIRRSLNSKRKEVSSLQDIKDISSLERELEEAQNEYNNRKRALDRSLQLLNSKENQKRDLKESLDSIVPEKEEGLLDFFYSEKQTKEKNVSSLSREIAVLRNEKTKQTNQLEISTTGVCYACGHEVDQAHIDNLACSLDSVKDDLNIKEENLKSLKDNLEEVNNKISKIERYESELRKKESLENQIEYINKEIKELKTTSDENEKSCEYSLNILNASISKKEEIDEIKKSLELKKELEEEIISLENELEEAQRIQNINEERKKFNEDVNNKMREHSKRMKELAELQNKHYLEMEVLKKALNIFETDFPNYIILKTCNQLESYINGFTQRVFPYMKVRLQPIRSGVEFYYVSRDSEEDWLSVKMASGAQSAILSLAWRVAIAKLYGISTILLDEADASSTEETAQIIYQFISELDTFDQLIFISHKKQAMQELPSLLDNLVCYNVQGGEFTELSK